VILAVWDFGRTSGARERAWFKRLVTVMIVLTGVILASALKRLALYEGTFGFTLARFTGYVMIALIAVFLAGTLALVWMSRREAVVVYAIGCIAAALLVMNVIGPESFVAERNVARFHSTGKIDAGYLAFELDYDAIPTTAALLPELSAPDAAVLREGLCASAHQLATAPDGWRSYNAGIARARSALKRAGIGTGCFSGSE
jgi:hypothetical protein